jgi:hypothetical protein
MIIIIDDGTQKSDLTIGDTGGGGIRLPSKNGGKNTVLVLETADLQYANISRKLLLKTRGENVYY